MKKIKILHLIKSLGRGGAEMLLPETLKLHDQNIFDFHYIYFLPWKDQMVDSIENAGGIVECFSSDNNIKLFLQYKNILSYCKTNEIDIIHCHLPWAGFVGRMVHKMSGIPVLYSEHNMQERYHKITKTINRLTFNSQDLAFGVSEDVSSSIRRNINPDIPVKTLLNGVNTEKFRKTDSTRIREELGIPENAIVLGNVAVFRFQKRLAKWLEVFKKVSEVNSNVYGIIVGAGPLEKEIFGKCDELKLNGVVFFPGLKTEVRPYFEAMDIFMMTSSFEGLPIALLEAMSMECAIVSTNAGGIKEVIEKDSDGLLCNADEWENLPEMIQTLIEDYGKLAKLKKAARKRVVENFSLRKMVKELENNYRNIYDAI